MATLAWKGKRAYAVSHQIVNGKSQRIWEPLGKFDGKNRAKIKFLEHLQWSSQNPDKPVLFSEISPRYLEYIKTMKAESTYKQNIWEVKALEKEFGNLRLDQITSQKLEEFKRKNNWKAWTWCKRLTILRGLLDYARNHGFRIGDPFKTVKIPRPKIWEFKPKNLPPEVLGKVIDELSEPYNTLALVLRYTGMRPSEVYKLKPEDIDAANQLICVHSQKVKRSRFIPIHPKIKKLLAQIPFSVKHISFQHALDGPVNAPAFRRR